MTKNKAEVEATEAAVETNETAATENTGVVVRRAFMLKQFLPNQDWINTTIVAGGKGTKATVGRIYGIATRTERKTNTLPDGSVSESIFVGGSFQSESYLDGVASQSSGVFFPMAYAEKIEAVFASGDIKTVEVDCDIGLEATGKTIPFAWVVTAFREGEEMDVLRRIKGNRARPAHLLISADGTPKALAAPAEQKALPSA